MKPWAVWLFIGLCMGLTPTLRGEKLRPDLVEQLREDEDAAARPAQDALVQLGEEAVTTLRFALGDPNFRVRRRAAEVLVRLGPIGKRASADLVELLQDPQHEVHSTAEDALAAIGAGALPALSSSLTSPNEGVRQLSYAALSRLGPPAVPLLLERLKREENVFLRVAVVNGLGAIHPLPPEATAALLSRLTDLEERVRGAAIDALGQQGAAGAMAIGPLLSRAALDKEALNRSKASQAVAALASASPEAMAELQRHQTDSDPAIRQEVQLVLDQLAPPTPKASPQHQRSRLHPRMK